MADDELRRFFYNNLRPEEPLKPGDHRWVDLSFAAANVLAPLRGRIVLDDQFTYQVLTGSLGSGKSTELPRVAKQLEADGFAVVYSRAEPLVQDFAATDIGEVLTYIAFALYEGGYGPGPFRGLLSDARELIPTDFEIKEAELSGGVAKLKAALTRYPTLREKVREAGREQTASLTKQLTGLIERAQTSARKAGKRGLVLILDTLDHLTGHPNNAAEVEESVRHVLLDRAELRQLPCHLILTVPNTMLRYEAALEHVYTGQLHYLPAVRVRSKDMEPDLQGLAILRTFLAERAGGVDKLAEVFGLNPRPMTRLVAASGGVLRDLMRLTRDCLAQTTELPITSDRVDRAIAQASRAFSESLFEEHKPNFAEMMASEDHRFPRRLDTWPLLQVLLRDGLLVRYQNGGYWEAPHPLLLRWLDSDAFEQLLSAAEVSCEGAS